jgi:hypothetical protein
LSSKTSILVAELQSKELGMKELGKMEVIDLDLIEVFFETSKIVRIKSGNLILDLVFLHLPN